MLNIASCMILYAAGHAITVEKDL